MSTIEGMRWFLLVFVVGCVSEFVPSAPQVQLWGRNEGAPQWTTIEDGVHAWAALGFELVDESPLEPCPHRWYEEGITECLIPIGIALGPIVVDGMEYGGLADRETRTVYLNDEQTGDAFAEAAMHEIGHILLDAGHLEPGEVGVMSTPYPMSPEPTEADYALACATIGICL